MTAETTFQVEFIRDLTEGWTGTAKLWRVDPPIKWGHHFEDDEGGESEYVVTSATVALFSGPETYVFPANADGEVVDWGELPGSFRGSLDHDAAIRGLGNDDFRWDDDE